MQHHELWLPEILWRLAWSLHELKGPISLDGLLALGQATTSDFEFLRYRLANSGVQILCSDQESLNGSNSDIVRPNSKLVRTTKKSDFVIYGLKVDPRIKVEIKMIARNGPTFQIVDKDLYIQSHSNEEYSRVTLAELEGSKKNLIESCKNHPENILLPVEDEFLMKLSGACFNWENLSKSLNNSNALNTFEKNVITVKNAVKNRAYLNLRVGNKRFLVLPFQLIHLGGQLTIAGEIKNETKDTESYLNCLNIKDIDEVQINQTLASQKPCHSRSEAEDFIRKSKFVIGNEERLVLRINSQQNINLNPDLIHLTNPFLTINGQGELIWAATVENSIELHWWLWSMAPHVEILDPARIGRIFQELSIEFEKIQPKISQSSKSKAG